VSHLPDFFISASFSGFLLFKSVAMKGRNPAHAPVETRASVVLSLPGFFGG
jgi:hypothetical protein